MSPIFYAMADRSCAVHQRLTTQLEWLVAEELRLLETGCAHAAARLRIDCRIEQVTAAYVRHTTEHGC